MSVLSILKPHAVSALSSTLVDGFRLLTADPKEVGYMPNVVSQMTIDVDLGSIKPVSSIYLGAMSGALDFQVQGGAAAYTTNLIGNVAVAPKGSGVGSRKWLASFAEQSWRYVRLTSTTNAPNLFEIGNLVVGKAFRPTWGHEYGGGRGVGDTGAVTRLQSGGFGINPGARFKAWDFTLGDLTDAEVEELYDIALEVGVTNPIVVCENPDITAGLDARIHYGLFAKLDRFERLIPGATKWNLKVEEWI